MHVRVERERRGGAQRYQPDSRDDTHGSSQAGHCVGEQRMADGEVALQAERHDYQHGHVGGPVGRREGWLGGGQVRTRDAERDE